MALSSNATHRYRFVWVKLWLGILLPEWAPIEFDHTAKEKLQQLRESSKGEIDPELKTVYQHLWDVHRASELAEYQPRLFHLFLCSIRSPTTNYVTSALRIRAGSYNDRLTSRHVRHLFANFLVEDSKGHLHFAHATAMNFILSMDANEKSRSPGVVKMFDARRNHLSVADSCITLIGDLDHQAWKHPFLSSSDGSFKNVSEMPESLDDLPQDNRNIGNSMETVFENVSELQKKLLRVPFGDWYDRTAMENLGFKPRTPLSEAQRQDSFAVYVLFFWWYHYWSAHRDEIISHKGWIKFCDKVIFPPRSAFFASVMVLYGVLKFGRPGVYYNLFRRRNDWLYYLPTMRFLQSNWPRSWVENFGPGHVVEDSKVEVKFLVLHALATLFPVRNGWALLNDADLKDFAGSSGDMEGSRLKRLLHNVRTQNAFGRPALHTSCELMNLGVIKLILEGTRLSEGEGAAMALLVDQDAAGRIALEHCFRKGTAGQATAEFLLPLREGTDGTMPRRASTIPSASFRSGSERSLENAGAGRRW